jgi:L-amino acid N-acyltransferase YncA
MNNADVAIRRAVPNDALSISQIYNEGIESREATFETELRDEATMRKWISDHDSRHPVLVATVGGSDLVVGWSSISTYRPRSCYDGVGEFSVYVRKDYQGRGIGRKLVFSLIDSARKLGYWKLVARIFDFNIASRNLCRSCGFREVGTYEKHGKLDGRWIDTVIVERLILENIK